MKAYASPEHLPPFGSLRTILGFIGSGCDVLDVGCAEGQLARHDRGRNNFWGVDYNAESLDVARPYYQDLVCLDLNSIQSHRLFAGRKFDSVVFADVLEHLLHPDAALIYAHDLLKAGGNIIVSLPNVALWRVRVNLLFGRFEYAKYGVLDDTHLHFYTFASARRLLEQCGFRIEKMLGAANELGVVARTVRPLRNLASINIVAKCSPAIS